MQHKYNLLILVTAHLNLKEQMSGPEHLAGAG